jgi:hypothetical protein
MSCCPQTTAPLTEQHRVRMRYEGGCAVTIKGPATGIDYHFSGRERRQLVHPLDAMALARNRLFRIESVVEVPAIGPALSPSGGPGRA